MRFLTLRRLSVVTALAVAETLAQGVITSLVGTEWVFPGDGRSALNAPLGQVANVVIDRDGNLVFGDPSNAMVMRVNADGRITVLAGNGIPAFSGNGGSAINASLNSPLGAAFDSTGNLYIADTGNHRIRKVTPNGMITTFAGTGRQGFGGDGGPANAAMLNLPLGVVIDAADNLYINDRENGRIRRVRPDGVIETIAGNGQYGFTGDNVPAAGTPINDVEGMAVDRDGNLYLAEFSGHRVRKISPARIITTVAGNGRAGFSGDNGPATNSSLNSPGGVAVDATATIYISDTNNVRVRRITPQGTISTVAGTGDVGYSGDGGLAAGARFASPFGLVLDSAGNLYIADRNNFRIRKMTAAGVISTVAGNGAFRFFDDGTAARNAFLFQPLGVAVDANSSLLIADTGNSRIRKMFPDGKISTIAGNGRAEYSGDGGPAIQAGLRTPVSVSVDRLNNIYITDTDGNRIRKVNGAGIISTFAGNGLAGVGSDGVDATRTFLNFPQQALPDMAGNILISDAGNNRLRRVGPDGSISTAAGSGRGGFSGDGGNATQALLNFPAGLAADTSNTVYFADLNNARIRRITPAGLISTYAGGGSITGPSAEGAPANQVMLGRPAGVAVDAIGNVYFTDARNHRVHKVTPLGVISTVAGNGRPGFAGDGGPAAAASLNTPWGVAVDAGGNVLIADFLNDRIRMVLGTPPSFSVSTTEISLNAKSRGPASTSALMNLSSALTGLSYTLRAITPDGVNWLKVKASSSAIPTIVEISADPAELAPGTYRGTVQITALGANPPTRVVSVTFSVEDSEPARLSLDTRELAFAFVDGDGSVTKQIQIANLGGGYADLSVSVSTLDGGAWLGASPGEGTTKPGQPLTLNISANPEGVASGTYAGRIQIFSAGVVDTLAIPIVMTVNRAPRRIVLSQTGMTFTTAAQGGKPLPQSFAIINAGRGSLQWSLQSSTLSGGAGWLQVTPKSGAVAGGASDPPLVEVSVDASGLSPGDYYGKIKISAPDADNSPQAISLILNILATGSNVGPDVRPTGLTFQGDVESAPGSQTILISNSSPTAITYTSTKATEDGGSWLVHVPANGTITADRPGKIVVQPDLSSLTPGVYRGVITLLFSDGTARNIGVAAVVASGAVGPSAARFAGGCTPSLLLPQFSSPAANFREPALQPVNVQVKVVDSCGEPMKQGVVIARFSNGDRQVDLVHTGNGIWSGTWQPRNTTQGQILIAATAIQVSGVLRVGGQVEISGSLRQGSAVPTVNPQGVLNGASFEARQLVAPGSLVSIFGERLAERVDSTGSVPFGTELGEAEVLLGDRPLPLRYASDGQINAQIPYDLTVNTQHQLIVRRKAALSVPEQLTVAPAQPAIFTVNQQGSGQGVIFKVTADGAEVLADINSPAHAGDQIIVYCNGLGAVLPAVPAGTAAPDEPASLTVNQVSLRIGSIPAPVELTRLAPGTAGSYQVRAKVPDGVTTGDEVLVTVSVAGQISAPATMAIR